MKDKKFCYNYPRPAVTTDNVIIGIDVNTIKILLIKRGNDPFIGDWAFPGGFLEMNETAEEGAIRELKEETGLDNIFLEQLHTFSELHRDPRDRIISIAFLGIVNSLRDVKGRDDAVDANWFLIDNLPTLAFDHQRILETAISYLKERLFLIKAGYISVSERISAQSLQTLYNYFK